MRRSRTNKYFESSNNQTVQLRSEREINVVRFRTHRCDHCSAHFPTKQRRDMHAARHTDERPVPCDRCDKSFKNKYDLKVHQRAHDDMRQHVCTICGNAFRAHTHLKNHLDSHATNNNYPCKFCDQKYKTQITLTRHITSMHTNKDEFYCAECGKSFGLKFRFEVCMSVSHLPRCDWYCWWAS